MKGKDRGDKEMTTEEDKDREKMCRHNPITVSRKRCNLVIYCVNIVDYCVNCVNTVDYRVEARPRGATAAWPQGTGPTASSTDKHKLSQQS